MKEGDDMKARFAIAASAIAVILACTPAAAEAAAPTTAAEADAEVQRLQAELEAAKSLAQATRELEAARAEAEAAGRRVAIAERVAGVSPSTPSTNAAINALAEQVAGAIKAEEKKLKTQEFGGIEFGAGFSFTLDVGTNDRISDAELVNGIVRVKDENNGRARIMLESHYFFTPTLKFLNLENRAPTEENGEIIDPGKKQFGIGPFFALQPGSDNIIEAIALGLMIGFRRGDTSESFNLGIGVVVDPNTKILGDGIVANQPLPAGETAIRFKEVMQTGVLVLASFSF